ncbi:uncharacterized protein MONBRDRAFT_30755 [Monosiga brevicollis MX1]|uniref:Glycosyl transferase family 25 domain-containing protein n=1 Tax=Monosiga brevicollis TaxID=81824 RepID=A9UP07_MONBE|nr:uncharacterized protein MONBRDRAFT_30755 [Monosiga brevicollis MX1]EDQ92791.1 predicted protein [Monosiga brevicollis MX1]|eukprot:XP_001742553.1 hypothetical protein [Monosiga brevicollis MX1]
MVGQRGLRNMVLAAPWALLMLGMTVLEVQGALQAPAAGHWRRSSRACPRLEKPQAEDVGFLVINLDRSPQRLARMRQSFKEHNLPPFERVRGVEASPDGGPYDVPRLVRGLKWADYGTSLAHLRAWKAAARSNYPWNIIIEDDATLLPNASYLELPPIPVDCDLILFRPSTIFEREDICEETPVQDAYWGYGMVAYLVSREGAQRMIQKASRGFGGPIDGHIWYHNHVCTMRQDYISHYECTAPCKDSIRTWLNGELADMPAPD